MKQGFYYTPELGGDSGNGAMEERLWEYIDGLCPENERSAIEKFLESNNLWKEKYHELLELHQLVQASTLEEPSLRFTKNVMEEISRAYITPAAKTYINKKVIWGIAGFMIVLILGFLVYGFGQIDWTTKGSNNFPVDFTKVDISKFFNNTYINIFMMANMLLGLMLLDRYLASRKKKLHKEA